MGTQKFDKWRPRSGGKAFDILAYAVLEPGRLTLEQIAQEIDLPVPSAYTFAARLRQAGLLHPSSCKGGRNVPGEPLRPTRLGKDFIAKNS